GPRAPSSSTSSGRTARTTGSAGARCRRLRLDRVGTAGTCDSTSAASPRSDMFGSRGTRRRRLIIVVEFVLGAVCGTTLGVLAATLASGFGWQIFGVWLAGACLNYVPLALHALSLLPPGRLEAELSGVDVPGDLRYYT